MKDARQNKTLIDIRVQLERFSPGEEIEQFRTACGDIGALANFVGYVRGESGNVVTLRLEHYAGFTEAQISKCASLAAERFAPDAILVIHRFGDLSPGEPIVLVAAAGQHRVEAIKAVEFLMDYLKTDAPFWKCETGPKGEKWIEPRLDDQKARKAWDA